MTVSVIVYGRNDNHGYNMHKRVAISLNSIAEVLKDPNDEIIFVDWNTPDECVTLIEDLYDTLTPKCKNLIKVFRVRQNLHEKISPLDSRRPTIEPHARNVGIRRSNPHNKWILSTNTDMVFLTEDNNLSSILENLEDGFYNAYRYEVPEYIWNQTERLQPLGFMNNLKSLCREITIKRKVFLNRDSHKVPDGPGDFQLAPRSAFFKINGFPESMKYGWHVDSAVSQLLVGQLGYPRILPDELLMGFHCNHLRQLTHFHTSNEKQNLYEYGDKIELSKSDWGLINETIEQVLIPERNRNINSVLEQVLKFSDLMEEDSLDVVTGISYPTELCLTFLLDSIYLLKPGSLIKYFGCNFELQNKLKEICEFLSVNIETYKPSVESNVSNLGIENCDLLIVDVGLDFNLSIKSFSRDDLNAFITFFEFLPDFARNLRVNNPNLLLCLLGPANWSMRISLNNEFTTPLFNNYGQILSGKVRSFPQSELNSFQIKVANAGVREHFSVVGGSNIFTTLIQFGIRITPTPVKRVLRPVVYAFFNKIQKLR